MRTVRRLYFYLLALIGSQVMIWGAINLVRTLVDQGITGSVGPLARGLALVLVGLPVFLFHWLTAQRDAARDDEESASRIRAVFLYAVRVWTLIPIVYSLLALFNRLIAVWMKLDTSGVIFGANQTAGDNLISIVVNLLFFVYFDSVLRLDWRVVTSDRFLVESRRLYRYLWVLFGLSVTIFGVQGILQYLFTITGEWGPSYGYRLANSLVMVLVGVPIWTYTWQLLQGSQNEARERESLLRLVILYIINLAGVVGVLASGGHVLTGLFALLLGSRQTPGEFLNEIGPALAVLIPMAVLWAFYWQILDREMTAMSGRPRREGVRRLYNALLSALGLAVTFTGIMTLFTYFTRGIFARGMPAPGWGQLTGSLAALAIGLPLWLKAWIPVRDEVLAEGDAGSRARRTLVRRAYLYLAVFSFVVALMVAAGFMLYNLVTHLLGSAVPGIAQVTTERLLDLLAMTAFLFYHQRILQQDARASHEALGALQAGFPVLLLGQKQDAPLLEAVRRALARSAPRLPVDTIILSDKGPGEKALNPRLVVIPSSLAVTPPANLKGWLDAFQGTRLVIPRSQEGWAWLGAGSRTLQELAEETAAAIRQMSEENRLRPGLPSNPWSAAGYVLGGILAIQLLFVLFSLLVSSLFG